MSKPTLKDRLQKKLNAMEPTDPGRLRRMRIQDLQARIEELERQRAREQGDVDKK